MDPTTAYALDVTEGRTVAGRLVRLACQRHLRDLETGSRRGLRWDQARAQRVIDFARLLCLAPGQPFELVPFEVFIVGSLFGWLGADGNRRFRTAYVEIGKGNGKSPLAALIGLYMLVADGEYRAEVYAAATKRDQAMILFRDAVSMARLSPALSRKLDVSGGAGKEWNIAYHPTASFFRAIGSDENSQSGPRPHCGLIDELHEHRTAAMADMMRAGTKSRAQALILEITNSGSDRLSVCRAHHDYAVKVLDGSLENDAQFAYVCGLDPCVKHQAEGRDQPDPACPDCDDWHDESCWPKANPGLGTILPIKYLRDQVLEADGMPSKEGVVKRLNFCLWTEGVTGLIPAELWATGNAALAPLEGRRSWAGLDLSNRYDVNALVFLFEPGEDGIWDLLPYFWIPADVATEREIADRVPYHLWISRGLVRTTKGSVADYAAIEEQVRDLSWEHGTVEVAYDPYEMTQMAVNLSRQGVSVVEFRQTMANYHEPTEELLKTLKEGKIRHGAHPVMAWMASNVAAMTDKANHIRPVKPGRQDGRKVDGVQALVMALGRAMLRDIGGPAIGSI